MTRPDTPCPEPGAGALLASAAELLGLSRNVSIGFLRIHGNGRELVLHSEYLSCNSAIPNRLLKTPPYHLALLKHEGLPVVLTAILARDDELETAGAPMAAGERIGAYAHVRGRWTCLGTADAADALVARVKAAHGAGAKRVALLRFPDWRCLNVVAVHGRPASVVELDRTTAPDIAAGAHPTAGRRTGPDLSVDVDREPLARAAEILGLGIGSFDVLVDPGGGILIAGYSDRVPWRLHCGAGFDPAPAVDVLRRYFELPAAAAGG